MIRNAGYMIYRYAFIYHHDSSVLDLLPILCILPIPCRLHLLPNLALRPDNI